MNRTLLAAARPLIIVFILFTAIFILAKDWFEKKDVDQDVLIAGNLLLFIVSMLSFLISKRSFGASNANVYVRSMYAGFMIRFFVLALAAFIYIMLAKKDVNKAALIGCAGLYVIYTAIETRTLLKLLKEKKNA